jgi:hypothetical protein
MTWKRTLPELRGDPRQIPARGVLAVLVDEARRGG